MLGLQERSGVNVPSNALRINQTNPCLPGARMTPSSADRIKFNSILEDRRSHATVMIMRFTRRRMTWLMFSGGMKEDDE